jgi:hypothetical protein
VGGGGSFTATTAHPQQKSMNTLSFRPKGEISGFLPDTNSFLYSFNTFMFH